MVAGMRSNQVIQNLARFLERHRYMAVRSWHYKQPCHVTEVLAQHSTYATVSVDVPVQTRTSPTTTATTSSTENLKCAVNETVVECGRVCEADCVSIFTRGDCDDCGSPACACMQGYARNPQGVCVYWGDCPTDGRSLPCTIL